MARQATTTDAFNAIADGSRRRILDTLRDGEHTVSQLVRAIEATQPQVSKHLRVLRAVGAVRVRADGRRRVYAIDPAGLKPLDDWIAGYRGLWDRRFDALDDVLDEMTRLEDGDG